MLSLLHLSGSPYSIGKALGEFGAPIAHEYLVTSPSWASVMQWRGSDAARTMRKLVQQRFPRIHEELQGLADGLKLDADDVFLWNCRGDIWAMSPDGCTTVQLPSANGPRIAHNEDGDPRFRNHCGLAIVAPDNGANFASFVYPASIPGHTFAVTRSGLAMTVNNLRARQVSAGVPRMVLTRAILNLATLEEAAALLNDAPRAGGFHLSLAQRGRTALYSVEFTARGVSVVDIQQPALHANHIIHASIRDLPQVITDSSAHRQARGEALLAASADINPLAILADQGDAELPIYRNAPNDPDDENTMATADIHIEADHIRWQVYDRPGQAPLYSLIDAEEA
ncbi:C45 family autoproteolytic acyltransferase/hydolase [Paracandidimonas lactea]|uniref:C45 family autoproteolytic acyltransferase/hydolase n=1 Tax=Paracandidimonas lactea TaxID=2895524 RepID=UPI001F280DD3|nr:C45 family peptidase [Paracandidimonas lactea]